MNTKTFLLTVIIISALLFSGCQKWETGPGIVGNGKMVKESHQVEYFNGLQIDVNANVTITQAAHTSVTVLGQQNILDILEIKIVNNVLLIQYKIPVNRHERLEIDIVVPSLNMISSFGSAHIKNLTPFSSNYLCLDIFGSGSITINQLNSENVRSRIYGSGNINLNGSAAAQQVVINGSGNYNATELLAKEAMINVFGSGNCNIIVSNTLSIAIHGSGSVYYSGNPLVCTTSVFGSGKIVQVQ